MTSADQTIAEGGFDQKYVTRKIERSGSIKTDVQRLVIGCDGDSYSLFLRLNHPNKDEEFRIEYPYNHAIEHISFEDITSRPEFTLEQVEIRFDINKDGEGWCEINNQGRYNVVDSDGSWITFKHYFETIDDPNHSFDTKNHREYPEQFIQDARYDWARENNYAYREWTVEDVEDPKDTETAILTVRCNGPNPTETEFEITYEDKPYIHNFVEEVGNGLISQSVGAKVLVTIDDGLGKYISKSDSLYLYPPSAKPSRVKLLLKDLLMV